MKFHELEEFKNDLKYLSKKYRSLNEDLVVVRKILMVMPDERPPFSLLIEDSPDANIIIFRKIACKSLKGRGINSGLQLLYALFKKEKRIVMIGLYHIHDKRSLERKIM